MPFHPLYFICLSFSFSIHLHSGVSSFLFSLLCPPLLFLSPFHTCWSLSFIFFTLVLSNSFTFALHSCFSSRHLYLSVSLTSWISPHLPPVTVFLPFLFCIDLTLLSSFPRLYRSYCLSFPPFYSLFGLLSFPLSTRLSPVFFLFTAVFLPSLPFFLSHLHPYCSHRFPLAFLHLLPSHSLCSFQSCFLPSTALFLPSLLPSLPRLTW